MVGTLEVVIIAAAGSLGFLFVSIFAVYLSLRARDRRLTQVQVARDFGNGQKHGVRNGNIECSNVSQPRTNLRRSVHLPYGIVSESWAAIPSRESLQSDSRGRSDDGFDESRAVASVKRRRSLRASFSAHSFSIPKTRRQKRIEKAVPLRALPHSPLSAITERSGTNTTVTSPMVGVAELPTETTPKSTPETDLNPTSYRRPSSLQWPLPSPSSTACDALPNLRPLPASRRSATIRMNTTENSMATGQRSLGPRSLSVSSTLSTAPEDPLPPLPLIVPNQWTTGRRSRLRFSASSIDTIGSSLLGEGPTSPSQAQRESTRANKPSPVIDPLHRGVQQFKHENQSQENAAVTVTGSPITKPVMKNPSISRQSFPDVKRASDLWSEANSDSTGRDSFIPRLKSSSLAAIHSAGYNPNVASRPISKSSLFSSSLPTAVARTATGCKKGTVASRHSMYEQRSTDGRSSVDPAILRDVSGNQLSPVLRPAVSRPVSVANDSPYHWESTSAHSDSPSRANSPPVFHSGGVKQQKYRSSLPKRCVPGITSKLAQMTEEETDGSESRSNEKMKVSGLDIRKREKKHDNAYYEQEAKNSVLYARPILKPTLASRPVDTEVSKTNFEGSYNPGSDVFRNPRYDPSAPNIFQESPKSNQPWAWKSGSKDGAQLQATPPPLKAIQDPYDPDSPTLPTPILSSATIFAQTLPLGSRISAVQGPRNLPALNRSSRTMSPSPSSARRIAKRGGARRSVMTFNRSTGDPKEELRLSQLFRDVDDQNLTSLQHEGASDVDSHADRLTVSVVDLSLTNQNAYSAANSAATTSEHHTSPSRSPSPSRNLAPIGLRLSKSHGNKISRSPSTISAAATSIWEDASVREDSPEPDQLPPVSSTTKPPQPSQHKKFIHTEADENFELVALDEKEEGKGKNRDIDKKQGQRQRRQKDCDRESKLTSPQGKGLGLRGIQYMPQQTADIKTNNKFRGTPRSLYDGDGFLRD